MTVYAATVGFPYPKLMAEVGNAESGGDPNIVNGIGAVGVLQILQPVHVKDHPSWTVSYLKNPLNNFKAGKVLWDAAYKTGGSGLEPWADSKDKGNGGGWGKTQAYKDYQASVTESGGTHGNGGSLGGIDGLGNGLGGTDLMGGLDGLGSIASGLGKAGGWMGNPRNWLRVFYVLAGGAVVTVVIATAAGGQKVTPMNMAKRVGIKR